VNLVDIYNLLEKIIEFSSLPQSRKDILEEEQLNTLRDQFNNSFPISEVVKNWISEKPSATGKLLKIKAFKSIIINYLLTYSSFMPSRLSRVQLNYFKQKAYLSYPELYTSLKKLRNLL
jgi:hypothetical protein